MHRYIPIVLPDDFYISGSHMTATIDSSLIDATLTDFPVGIDLSASDFISGKASTDWQNLHCTVGGTECCVEVDVWDMVTPKAIIWVKVPSVSSSVDTVIKIVFGADNTTTYVGETGDTAAQNVWDSYFKAVYHMSQDPSTGGACILDSTSNEYHGTPAGTMTSGDLVDGGFGKSLDFDGSNDKITLPDLLSNTAGTVMFYHKLKSFSSTGYDCLLISGASGSRLRLFNFDGITTYWNANIGTSTDEYTISGYEWAGVGMWESSCIAYNTSDKLYYYQDGVLKESLSIDGTMSLPAPSICYSTYGSDDTDYTSIYLSEIHISNTVRSAAWIKATNAVLAKTLVTLS